MSAFIMIIAVLSGIYGLMWLIFVVVDPPPSVSRYFQAPQGLYFLGERLGRLAMAVLFGGVIPFGAKVLLSIFLGGH